MYFAVLALGDTSYDFFCQAGKFIDVRLEQLGAQRVYDRIDCDIDYENCSNEWIAASMLNFSTNMGNSGNKKLEASVMLASSNKNHPYPAILETNKRLSG